MAQASGPHGTPDAWRRYGGGSVGGALGMASTALFFYLPGDLPRDAAAGLLAAAGVLGAFGVYALHRARR